MRVYRKRIPVGERTQKMLVYSVLEKKDYELLKILLGDTNAAVRKSECISYGYRYIGIRNQNNENVEIAYFSTIEDILVDNKEFWMFSREERSTFRYWFAHWCAFQTTALNLGIWKFKYLFHDAEKPWLRLLFRKNYKKVQKWHREHNRHHLEYGLIHGFDKIDWVALTIDWECCMLSKRDAQKDARESMEEEISHKKWKPYEKEIRSHMEPVLYILGL